MDLPNEIKDQIIQVLDDKSRRQLRTVNREWFNLVHYDHFEIYYATPKSLPTIVERLSQYQWPFGLALLRTINLTATHIEEQIFKLSQLTSLRCQVKPNNNSDKINPNWTKLTTLTNLQRLDLTQTPIPVHLISYYTNLTSLRGVHVPSCDKDKTELLFSKCTKLEYLELAALAPQGTTKAPCLDQLHRLTRLYVNAANEMLDLKMMTNLRELTTIFIRGVDIGFLTTLEKLNVENEIVGDISANKNLTEFILDLQRNARHVTALSSLKSLEILHLVLTSDNTGVDNNQVLLMTPQNLTSLALDVNGEFNIKNISHLTNLRALEMCSSDEMQYQVTAEDFKPFSHLTYLSAGQQFAALKYLPELRDFSTWDYFSLSDGSTMDDFDPTCVPKLERLSFSNSVPSRVFNRLSALRSLKTLMAYELPNDKTYDYNVLSCMDLERLEISPPKLAREDWLVLQKLSNLTWLQISAKEVTDDMTLLTSLTKLKNLFVENAKLEHWLPFTFLERLTCYPFVNISQQQLDENFPYLYQHSFKIVD